MPLCCLSAHGVVFICHKVAFLHMVLPLYDAFQHLVRFGPNVAFKHMGFNFTLMLPFSTWWRWRICFLTSRLCLRWTHRKCLDYTPMQISLTQRSENLVCLMSASTQISLTQRSENLVCLTDVSINADITYSKA